MVLGQILARTHPNSGLKTKNCLKNILAKIS